MNTIKIIAYSTVRETVSPSFHHDELVRQSRADAEMISHLNSVINWACDFGKAEMTPKLYSVLRHVQRTQNLLEFDVHPDHLQSMGAWARQSNAIFGLPDRTLRDPDGAILVDPQENRIDSLSAVPYPDDAVTRRQANREALLLRGIPTHQELPPVAGESEVMVREADEVGWRTLALFIVAVRAESLASQQPIPVEQLRAKSPMAFEAMSPLEREFIDQPSPDPQTIVNFAWRYEALFALQWALGLHDQMPFPDNICDVPAVAETMVDREDREMVVDAQLRPVEDLLDAVDLNGQLLWAARQAKLEKQDPPSGIDGGVLVERQHALNWLIRMNDAAWDEVDTPT